MTEPEPGRTLAELRDAAPSVESGGGGTPVLTADAPLRVGLGAAIIVFAGAAAFSATLGVPFHFEDRLFVSENAAVHSLATIQNAFGTTDAGPVVWLAYAINWLLAPGSAAAFHAVNLALHLLNALLVYFICRVYVRPGEHDPLPWIPLAAGLLFALHPLSTESVNLVVGRSALLAATFCLATVLAFLYIDSDRRRIAAVATLVLAALAFGAHHVAWMLPVFVIAADWCRAGAGMLRRLPFHAVIVAMAIGAAIAAVFGQGEAPPAENASPMHLDPALAPQVVVARAADLSINRRPLSAVQSAELDSTVVTFAGSAVENFEPTNVVPGIAIAVLAVLGGATGLWFRKLVGVGLVWYAAALIFGAVWARNGMPFSERAVYPAIAGLALAGAGALSFIGGRQRVRLAAGACTALLLIVCAMASFMRSRDWLDEQTIWELARENAAKSPVPYHRLAVVYGERGDDALINARALMAAGDSMPVAAAQSQARDAFTKAAEFAAAAIENGADESPIRVLLGRSLHLSGASDDAETILLDVLHGDPGNRAAAIALAAVYEARATSSGDRAAWIHALDLYESAMNTAPPSYDELLRYGRALLALGDLTGAQAAYARAAQLEPGESVQTALADLTANLQRINGMDLQAAQITAANPDDPSGPLLFATAAVERSDFLVAVYTLADVLDKHPNFTPAWVTMGFAQARMGQADVFLDRYGTAPPPMRQAPPVAAPDAPPIETQEPPPPWIELAIACARFNLWDEAATYLMHAGEYIGDPRLPMIIMADLARETGSAERYLDFLQRATESHPESAEPWLRLCDLSIQMKNAVAAKEALDEAVKRGAPPEALGDRQKQVDELLASGVESLGTVS